MEYRFNKRIRLDKGIGITISKSSITPSYKSKLGSINPKGYSIRIGILNRVFFVEENQTLFVKTVYAKSNTSSDLNLLIRKVVGF